MILPQEIPFIKKRDDHLKNLRNLRIACGLTQRELADKLGVAQCTIVFWEQGSKYPTADKLPAIARLLGCSIDDLYREQSACLS